MRRPLLLGLILQICIAHQAPAAPSSDAAPGSKPRVTGVVRAGHSTWSNPLSAGGSWSVSGGVSCQVMDWLAVGPDGGYQSWETLSNEPGPSPVHAVWNATAGLTLNDFGLYRRLRLDPQVVLALVVYGRRFHDPDGGDQQQVGPGFSLGLGLRYFPPGLRPRSGMDLGFGIIGRRHVVMMDDYGVAFGGPENEWTKTWEVAAEVLVGWE